MFAWVTAKNVGDCFLRHSVELFSRLYYWTIFPLSLLYCICISNVLFYCLFYSNLLCYAPFVLFFTISVLFSVLVHHSLLKSYLMWLIGDCCDCRDRQWGMFTGVFWWRLLGSTWWPVCFLSELPTRPTVCQSVWSTGWCIHQWPERMPALPSRVPQQLLWRCKFLVCLKVLLSDVLTVV